MALSFGHNEYFNFRFFLLATNFQLNEEKSILNEKSIAYVFLDYVNRNSQNCLTKTTLDEMQSLDFVKEPYAWLMGQAFKYLLEKNQNFDKILKETIKGLNIDFNYPIAG